MLTLENREKLCISIIIIFAKLSWTELHHQSSTSPPLEREASWLIPTWDKAELIIEEENYHNAWLTQRRDHHWVLYLHPIMKADSSVALIIGRELEGALKPPRPHVPTQCCTLDAPPSLIPSTFCCCLVLSPFAPDLPYFLFPVHLCFFSIMFSYFYLIQTSLAPFTFKLPIVLSFPSFLTVPIYSDITVSFPSYFLILLFLFHAWGYFCLISFIFFFSSLYSPFSVLSQLSS